MCIRFVQQGMHAHLRVFLIFMALGSQFAQRDSKRKVPVGVAVSAQWSLVLAPFE